MTDALPVHQKVRLEAVSIEAVATAGVPIYTVCCCRRNLA
jgi:hypothetical protein